ncbi:hypothetical protein [Pinibacter aurantiacus]|uniref:Uncharacterized protein n=1 Tax=Pinibacter aurantiacus TaxID=2851599 RepID=A0A9E2W7W0_9BACT|nr:hypothetical protein [Pinibacter aurantiacus]MBV4356987.1 hypothetical protein [Pinibacter aurantiacus]
MRRLLCCAGIALLFIFNGCKKQEKLQPESDSLINTKFFSTSQSTTEPVKRVVAFLKQNNDAHNYIANLVKNEGYAYWNNSTISIQGKDTTILVPLVPEEEEYVASFILARLNGGASVRVISGREYAKYGYGHSTDSINAQYIARKLMYFDNAIFGDTLFKVTDKAIFGADPKDSSYYHFKLLKQDRRVQTNYVPATQISCYTVTHGDGWLTGNAPGQTPDYYYSDYYCDARTIYVEEPNAYQYPVYVTPPSRPSTGGSNGGSPVTPVKTLCRDANGKIMACNPLVLAPNEVDNLLKELFNVTPKDIAPNKWYFYSSVFGWTETKLPISGVFNESVQNAAGYYSGNQVLQFLQKASENKTRREREEQVYECYKAAYEWAKASNLFGLMYEMSPVKAIYDGSIAYGDGQYIAGTILVASGTVDLGPLFKAAKSYAQVATEMAAKFTTAELWAMEGRMTRVRGMLMEAKQAVRFTSKGYKWMGEVNKYFRTIDFYEPKLQKAISYKTVNAKVNFDFKDIIDNITVLKGIKDAGKHASDGIELVIRDVELHIDVPKGYDQKVLDKVRDAAKDRGIMVVITEVP